ncbi:MAG: sugar ABC transporter permease [Lachnospiraceae bacterium]|nr:sugar ABC transporter permease [Lachnospiraceae bacterium]
MIERGRNMHRKKGYQESFSKRLKTDLRRNWSLYLLVLPVLLFYIAFKYKPMYGALIAFMDYTPTKGMANSEWVGLKHFSRFFSSPYFWRLLKNTFLLSFYNLLFGFPAPIILALLLNEVKNAKFKKFTQTVTYLPHFLSLVVICGMVTDFSLINGLFNSVIEFFGGTRTPLLQNPDYYRTIYVLSGIWKEVGWGSIIYLAALSGIDTQLYEAAKIDGAGKWKQMIHVTLPGITPQIVILLIMKIGNLMSMGYEKTILLYNPSIYETADIISSYVYRSGLMNQEWGYSTAIGLFNSLVNCTLVVAANYISRKTTENSLW